MKRCLIRKTTSVILIVLLVVTTFQLTAAALNVSLSDQGTGVKDKSTGELLEAGNLTVEIYDSITGGTQIYSEEFTDAIVNGSWNVMLGEMTPLQLEYGKRYYRDYQINNEDASFTNGTGDTVERQFFYSSLGDINGTKLLDNSIETSKMVLCPEGQILKVDSGQWACAAENVATSEKWNITDSIYLINNSGTLDINGTLLNQTINELDNDTLYYANGLYIYNNGSNWFYLNETKLNNTIDARAVTNLTNYALTNESETFTGNITTSETGFFGWLGSISSRITGLFVQDVDASGNINASNFTLNGTTLNDWNEIATTDTQKSAEGYLYNDTTTIFLNGTLLNQTINELDNDTLYYANGLYIYNNGSNWFYLNETKLNNTIDARAVTNLTNYALTNESETFTGNITADFFFGDGSQLTGIATSEKWNITDSIYLINNSGTLDINETILNESIESRVTEINNDTVWDINGSEYLIDDSDILDVNETALDTRINLIGNLYYNDTDAINSLESDINTSLNELEETKIENGTNVWFESVGIGKSTLGANLTFDMVGDAQIDGNLTVLGTIIYGTSNQTIYQGSIYPDLDATYNVGNTSKRWKDGYFSGTVSTTDLNVTNVYASGDVGIGTTDPDAKLVIEGSTPPGTTDPTNSEAYWIQLRNTYGAESFHKSGIVWDLSDLYSPTAYIMADPQYSSNANTDLIFGTRGTSGSASEKMRITHEGNVGIGTTSPNANLEVETSGSGEIAINSNTGWPTLRLRAASATNDYQTLIAQSTTDGTLQVRVGQGSTGVDSSEDSKIVITNEGNVGIGTYNPRASLDINTAPAEISIGKDGRSHGWIHTEASLYFQVDSDNDDTNREFGFNTNGGTRLFTILDEGNVGIGTTNPGSYKLYVAGNAYTTGSWGGSDVRWKKNITPINNSLEKVRQLQGVKYNWRTEEFPDRGFTNDTQIGLIAQEVEKVIPEVVHTDEDGYKAIAYDKLTAVLTEAVKELSSENEALRNELESMKSALCSENSERAFCADEI